MHAQTRTILTPLALKDAPALIETVFPAQKVSFEAQRERKAGSAQTLTGLGSYWKGRKPLILVRAIVLGSLLPPTHDPEADLAVFEALLAFDDEGLTRRALAANAFSAAKLQEMLAISDPERFFSGRGWRRDVSNDDKLELYRRALAGLPSYEAKAALCKRPEEVDQDWLFAPVWPKVNRHYAHLGLDAHSFPQLIEQLGILRYGHRPRVGDTFSGGGSIPFEAARLGCDVYASDLNPVACMLTWGALNIIGASPERRAEIQKAQREVAQAVDAEITRLGIEHDEHGNRAKAYLYCLEARCPETGWWVPLAPSWVISKTRNVIARLVPDPIAKHFAIEIVSGVSDAELKAAERGTVQDGDMVYELDGKTYRTPIKTLRGDYRLPDGTAGNRLRRWEKGDFKPRPDDIFQERLYCIQWIKKETLDAARQDQFAGSELGRTEGAQGGRARKGAPQTWFAAPTEADLARERKVEAIVAENLARWQEEGLVPDMPIEPGDKTDEPIRTRGWTHWHHLFNARQLHQFALWKKYGGKAVNHVWLARALDFNSRLNPWVGQSGYEKSNNVFSNQALNTLNNYCCRAWGVTDIQFSLSNRRAISAIDCIVKNLSANSIDEICQLWITDPPTPTPSTTTRSPSSSSPGCARTRPSRSTTGCGIRAGRWRSRARVKTSAVAWWPPTERWPSTCQTTACNA
jgi:adenine-specific DNA methylase